MWNNAYSGKFIGLARAQRVVWRRKMAAKDFAALYDAGVVARNIGTSIMTEYGYRSRHLSLIN